MIKFKLSILIYFLITMGLVFLPALVLASVAPINCQAKNDTTTFTPKVLQINIDPDVNVNGVTQNIRSYMRSIDLTNWNTNASGTATGIGWADPLDNGNDLVSLIGELSSNKVNYSIAQTIKLSSFSDVPLLSSSNVKSNMTQDQFFTCHQVDNDPETINATATVANATVSRIYPEATAAVQRSYTGGEVLTSSCYVTDYQGTDWILNKVNVNGVIKKEYVKKSDLTNFSSPPMDCLKCASEIDIAKLDQTYDICGKANRGEIDEVWIWDPMFGIHSPYIGGIESTVLEPKSMGGLRLSHGYIVSDACNTAVPVNISNFERTVYSNVRSGNAGAIHIIGHRMEASIANYLYQRNKYDNITHKYGVDFSVYNRSIPNFGNLPPSYPGGRFSIESSTWKDGVYDVNTPGCGTIHADPLSPTDYVHNSSGTVDSSCYNSQTGVGYNMTGIIPASTIGTSKSSYTCSLWGCNADGWAKYWFQHIPQNLGADKEMLNDWWGYYIDPEKAITKFANADACSCPAGYNYNPSTKLCDIFSCTDPANTCAIQNQTNKPICDSTSGACVECTTSNDCPVSKNFCDATKSCIKCRGVISDSSCLSCFAADSTKPNYDESTSSCTACNAGTTWNGTSCIPTGCTTGQITCGGATPYCNTKQDICAACVSDANCAVGQNCLNGTCNNCLSPNPASNTQVTGLGTLPYCATCATKQNPETAFCPVCASNETSTLDPRSGLMICQKNTCGGSGVACGGSTPWCDGSACKACQTGSNYSTVSNSCVFCASDEQWDAGTSKCVLKSCTNGGLTCSGAKPVCDTTANSCVQCNVNSDCASGFCNNKACAACPSGQFKNSGGSCVTCSAGQIWDMNTLSCVTPAACPVTGQVCNNQSVPVCGSGFGSCLQCNTDAECQNTNSPSYNPDKQYCQTSTKSCVRCPLSSPNYDTRSKTCGPACPSTNQIWNGRECIGEGTTKAPNVCFNLDEGQFQPQIVGSLPFIKSSFCNINQPYCSGVGGSVYNNAPITGQIVCKECLDNASCSSSHPLCEAGKCQVCPASTPFFNSTTNSCQSCDITTPIYDPTTRTCNSCPAGQTFDKVQNKCLVPTCTNGLLTCAASTPICTAASTCVECENSNQCGGAKPACQNNVCVNCDLFDPNTGACIPNGQAPTPSALKWNGSSYVAPTCANGGITCSGTLKCDTNTNTCKECLSDAQCSSAKPVCNTTTLSCEACPTATPQFAAQYLLDDEYDTYLTNTQISSPTNVNISSIAGITNTETKSHEPIVHVVYSCQACPTNSIWDGTKCVAQNCNSGLTCSSGKVCDTNSGTCLQCLTDANCSVETPSCNAGTCRKCPTSKPYFDATLNACAVCPTGLHWYNDSCIADTALNLHGTVVRDVDSDQQFDITDSPIPNVTVRLIGYDAAGKNVMITNQTDLNGKFKFDDVAPGNYSLVETQPPAFDNSTVLNNNIGVLGITDTVSNIKLLTQPTTEVQFLETGWKLSGYVYVDSNLNGVKDSSEPGLANETVKLSGTPAVPVNLSTTTDSTGYYEFTNLLNGDYTISETQPLGYNSGSENNSNSKAVTINSNSIPNINFGEVTLNIQSGVFMDIDNSNTKTIEDIPVQNVELKLEGIDSRGVAVSKIIKTRFDGMVIFSGLLKGDYTISETQPSTATDGPEIDGTTTTTITNDKFDKLKLVDDATGYYFLEKGFEVSGKVFIDSDQDITQDTFDFGIFGVKVELQSKASVDNPYPSVLGAFAISTYTDKDGKFKFTNIPDGDYTIVESQPTIYDTNNSNSFDFTVHGASLSSFIFSEKPGSISGNLFQDLNSNGNFDSTDKALENVVVELFDSNNQLLTSITTDASGKIQFTGLAAGKYKVNIPSLNKFKIVDVSPGQDVLGMSIAYTPDLGKTGGDYLQYLMMGIIFLVISLSMGLAFAKFAPLHIAQSKV